MNFRTRFLSHLHFDTHKLAAIAVMIALTVVSAYLPAIPISPGLAVSYQSFCAVLSGLLLGAVWGAVAQLIYLCMGLFGLPVFKSGGGFAYVFQPSFGYVIGFVFGAFATGLIADCFGDAKVWKVMTAAVIGNLMIYPIGVPYQYWAMVNFAGITPEAALGYLAATPLYMLGDGICLILIACMPIGLLRRITLDGETIAAAARRRKKRREAKDIASDGSHWDNTSE